MPSVCFYFQVHQPYRLKAYSYFKAGHDHHYFDEDKNGAILRKVADKCYLPTNKKILELIDRHEGRFKVSYAITGTALEQMERYCPEALESFVTLSKTGCVEFISETYYHSLSAVYSQSEFVRQIAQHKELMIKLFNYTPTVFRNTELIYDNGIGAAVAALGYEGMIAEGVDDVMAWRSPNYLYTVPGTSMKLLLKNYRLSDDIAFRFSNRGWECYPLTAPTFASWVHKVSGNGDTVNLFMDYETFGEHQWASTGIFEFLDYLPTAIMAHPDWGFKTPQEVIASYPTRAELSFHRLTSWADVDRDLTAWRGNRMQESALSQAFALESAVQWTNDPETRDIWGKLLTSDHFYYMCTKWFADGDVHAYFSPYSSPYEAFINYANVLRDFKEHYLGVNPEGDRANPNGR
jgi:alpha-amylase